MGGLSQMKLTSFEKNSHFETIPKDNNYFCSICPVKNEFSSIYFPFNFIVFLRYLDLNYRGRFITRTGIFITFIGITFVRNEIF